MGRQPSHAVPRESPIVTSLAAEPALVSAFMYGFALSPDARTLVYAARTSDGTRALWRRRLSDVSAERIGGTEWAEAPFFSPDGRDVAFFADGTLKRVPLAGGVAQTICAAPGLFTHGSWGTNGGDPPQRGRRGVAGDSPRCGGGRHAGTGYPSRGGLPRGVAARRPPLPVRAAGPRARAADGGVDRRRRGPVGRHAAGGDWRPRDVPTLRCRVPRRGQGGALTLSAWTCPRGNPLARPSSSGHIPARRAGTLR